MYNWFLSFSDIVVLFLRKKDVYLIETRTFFKSYTMWLISQKPLKFYLKELQ